MNKKIKITLLIAVSVLLLATNARAAIYPTPLPYAGGWSLESIYNLIDNVVQYLIRIAGILIVGMFIYSGVLWATSASNEGQVDKAKAAFSSALWGTAIILGVYVIINTINFIISGTFFN